jgi:hypothetical protein
MSPLLFDLVIFKIGSCVYAQASLGHDPPSYAFLVLGMTDVYHHRQLFIGCDRSQ